MVGRLTKGIHSMVESKGISQVKMFWSVLAALIVFTLFLYALFVGDRAVNKVNSEAVSASCLRRHSECMISARSSEDPKEAVQMCGWDFAVCGKVFKY
jgi:hypothetical protein